MIYSKYLKGFTITFLHSCYKCSDNVAGLSKRGQFPLENKYKSRNSIIKKKHISTRSKTGGKVRNPLSDRFVKQNEIQLKQALENGATLKKNVRQKLQRKVKSNVCSKPLGCQKLLNKNEKKVNDVSENVKEDKKFPTTSSLEFDSRLTQSVKIELKDVLKYKSEALDMLKVNTQQTESEKKEIHFHANPQNFQKRKLTIKKKNMNSKISHELDRKGDNKEDQSICVDKKFKSPSPKKGKKTPKINDEKVPKKGTLKRKRWCFRKLKQCNENQEDDLYADQKLCNFVNLIEDDSDNEYLDIATPKGTISMSPRSGSRTPDYEDCYNLEELDDLRKEAENYAYRQKKRKKSMLKDKKCKKGKTETKRKIKFDINRTLDQVCRVLFAIYTPLEKSRKDNFFREVASGKDH